MDRTAAIFVVIVLGLILTGIIRLEDSSEIRSGDIRIYEARVTLEGEEGLLIFCDVADNDFERTKGLMDRMTLGKREGMLFIYDPPQEATFWMKNTYIDLDIVFISEDLKVMKVYEADAGAGKMDSELELFSSGGECAFVLEMNRGLSEEFGIVPGSNIDVVI
jgi:uncharacterized membrane protein (UPF0127 family)